MDDFATFVYGLSNQKIEVNQLSQELINWKVNLQVSAASILKISTDIEIGKILNKIWELIQKKQITQFSE